MGSCIICGASVQGNICDTHEEDVVFEFKGNSPDQLVRRRYYRGEVDGVADFGVFVDIGPSVTGLLHASELDRRLESYDFQRGDELYVQVLNVHDNGNIDLGWSIRQSPRDFRGKLVQEADGSDHLPAETATDDSTAEASTADESTPDEQQTTADEEGGRDEPAAEMQASAGGAGAAQEAARESDEMTRGGDRSSPEAERATENGSMAAQVELVKVHDLSDRVGDVVRLEGEIVGARQTSGPTVFELGDETGVVDCAAFVEAGVRAYPEVDVGDFVRLEGEVELRHNELQVETEALVELEGEDRETVEDRLEAAVNEEAHPESTDLLAEDAVVERVHDEIIDAATTIRRAVIESRPVIVRHTATVEGYAGGAAIERAVLPLVREKHAQSDAEYHYFDRRPLEDGRYDMDAATGDVTSMLDNASRHDEKHPLFVLVGAGSTRESLDGFELLDIYDAKRVVVDGTMADEEVADAVDVIVNPTLNGGGGTTAGALGAQVAVHVNDDVRDDLRHLPAVSFWDDTPDVYADLAVESGYDAEEAAQLRNAVALEAFYQSYEDKRELIADLFWDEKNRSLAAHVSNQFQKALDREIDTAHPHLDEREVDGVSFAVLDTDAFTHRYSFPRIDILLDELHRRERESVEGPFVTVAVGTDELRLRSTQPVDLRAVGETVAEQVPDAGVTPVGTTDGSIEFVAGERDAVVDAVVDVVADRL